MRVRKETGANWSEYIYFGSEVLTELATAPGLTSSALSQSGLSAFNPSVIVDGGTACCGWHTDTATAGAFLRADLGAPAAVASVRIYASTPGYAGNYSIQRSDDNSNWTTVATFAPNAAGWNTVKWVQVTAHRYWRLHLNNTPGSGSWLNELQFGVWTDYIFAGGKRVAKAPGVAATSGTQYYHSDHLGSARLMTDASGNPVAGSEGTFLPFGQEYAPTTAGNHYKPGSPANRFCLLGWKFTGKERDSESGLDYFGARYYGSAMGRWLSPDPLLGSGRPGQPQSWNRYSYVINNPLTKIDPDGLYETDVHQGLTEVLAMAAGFDDAQAAQIASANEQTDHDPNREPCCEKDGPAIRRRELFHFTTAARREEMWSAFTTTKNLGVLGIFMHAQQDSFSHAGYGAEYGHAFDLQAPDKTRNDPAKADRMARDSYARLSKAAEIVGAKHSPVAWAKIDKLVQKFNREKSDDKKKKILEEIKTIIDKERKDAPPPSPPTGK